MGVKRADKRKLVEMLADVGVPESAQNKLSRVGRVERMGDENWQREQMPRRWTFICEWVELGRKILHRHH